MKKLAIVFLAVLVSAPAFATNGYFLHGQGSANKAMAGAGTALPQEALDVETNPAAGAFLPWGYSVSLALFSPDRSYTVSGAPSGVPQTFGLTPGTVTSKSTLFPMPAFGINFKLDEKSAVTVNFTAHGGMNTDYRTNTFYGASGHTGVDLGQAFLTATYARKLTQNQSAGVTAIVAGQRFKAQGLEQFAAFSSNPDCLSGNGYETSYGAGVKVGYLAKLTPKLAFGASFAPRIHMSDFKSYCGLFAQNGRFDIPTTLNTGIAVNPYDDLTLTADYQKIHYADVKSVGNPLFPNLTSSPLGAATGAGFGWKDINVYKAGVQYKANADWTLRAGYSQADQPIPSSEVLFNILAPGIIERHITAGFSKSLQNAPGRFNFALMYAPNKTVRGANPLEVPGQQQISLKMHEWEVEFGYSLGF